MKTVSELAQLLQTSTSSIRTWSAEFAPHLSPTAAPQSGEVRNYQDIDVAVLYVVKQLRDQQIPYNDIHESLRQGAAKDVVLPKRVTRNVKLGKDITWPNKKGLEGILSHVQSLTELLREEHELLREERGYLRSQLETERNARIEAEKRAAVAEARVKFLEESPKK